MKSLKKPLALLLTMLMLVSALPLGVFAAEATALATATTAVTAEDNKIYYKYTFEEATPSDTVESRAISAVGEKDSNPMKLSQDGSVPGHVVKENGNQFYRVEYPKTYTSWHGMRFSLYDGVTNHIITNGVAIDFDFRWLGTGSVTTNAGINFVKLRRSKGGNIEAYLIEGSVDANGSLTLKTGSSVIATFPKQGAEGHNPNFTNIRVEYYDTTYTYNIYIGGQCVVEGMSVDLVASEDMRTGQFIDSKFDSDYFTTSRDNISIAGDRWSFEIARINATKDKEFNYVMDFDNVYINGIGPKEGRSYYYNNSFDNTTLNGITARTTDMTYYFRGTAPTITKTGDNGYISFGAKSRMDLRDTYQIIQDGNWTVSFKLQGTVASTDTGKKCILRIHNRIDTLQFLQLDKDGNLYLGNNSDPGTTRQQIPGVKVPAVGSDDWVEITVSCLVNNQNHTGVYSDFVAPSSPARRYTFILWVDGKLCGAMTHSDAQFLRSELNASGKYTVNDMSFTQNILDKELTHEEMTAKGYTLVEETSTRKTYYNEKTYDYYQFQYADGAFKTGVFFDFKTAFSASSKAMSTAEGKAVLAGGNWTLSQTGTASTKDNVESRNDTYLNSVTGEKAIVTMTRTAGSTADFAFKSAVRHVAIPSYTNNDVLGFFDQNASTITANIDDLKLYSGIGYPTYADGADDKEGVINEVEFANLATNITVSGVGNVVNNRGGRHGIIYSENFVSSKVESKSETANGKKVNYVTLTSGTDDVFLHLNADYSGGKVFAAELTVRKLSGLTEAFHLIRLFREGENDASITTTDLLKYSYTKKTPFFTMNGVSAYIVDGAGKPISLAGNEWTTFRVVIDESGKKPLVTFYVNGKVANYYTDDMLVPLKAINLEGVISDDFSAHKYDIDQRVTFIKTIGSSAIIDLLDAKIEYAEAPKNFVWADSVALDFSKISDVSQLGDQFLISDGVYIENGELVIPNGETFGWLDYNGTFAEFARTNGADPTYKYRFNDGYAFEMKVKAASSGSSQKGLLKCTSDAKTGNNMMYMQRGKIYMSGAISGYTLNTLESGQYSDISLLYTNNETRGTVFADGKMIGMVGFADGTAITNLVNDEIAFMFADGIKLAELYIHRDQKRVLATNSGDIFELDPDAWLPKDPKDAKYYPFNPKSASGVMDSDTNAFRLYAAFLNDDEVGNYYRFNMVKNEDEIIADDANTADVNEANYGVVVKSQTWNDIVVTDYLEDRTTVFEYDIRFKPHVDAREGYTIQLLGIRRTEEGSSSNKMEDILLLGEDGTLKFLGYTLCNTKGIPYKLDGSKWVNISVIYDANAGKASCIVDGQILHYKNSKNVVLGLADKVQLATVRYYRMDAADTKIRFFNTSSVSADATVKLSALGMLDIAGLKIYNIDDTANVGYIGVQKDTSNNNIRLVAGSDMLYYGNVGFDVVAFDANGNLLSKDTKSYSTNAVYSSIIETVEGVKNIEYPENFGYRYFYTANIMDVDQEKAVKLNVTPFSIVNGEKYPASTVTLEIDFTRPMDQWVLSDVDSVEIKPQGDNMNANFSTTDIVKYTNGGSLELNGLGAKFGFAADLKGGVVSVNLTNAKGEDVTESVFDIYVDGVLTQKDLTLEFGHHTIVLAENKTGEHEFVIVKKSGGDYVCINNMSLYGTLIDAPELAEENAVIVTVAAPGNNVPYGTVNVYARTSDSTENYYIKYQFSYLNYPLNNYNYITGPANSHNNAKMYRINTATIVNRASGSDVTVYQILQGGEISLAIKEGGHVVTKAEYQAAKSDVEKCLDTATDNGYIKRMNAAIAAAADGAANTTARAAGDFVGGWHGDENIEDGQIAMYLDGKKLDLTKAGSYTGTHFIFDQTCIIDRCDEPETQVMRHRQYMLIDTNGFRNDQTVEFLTADFVPDETQSYLQMCTFNRQNFSLSSSEKTKPENYICAVFNLLDANGTVLSEHDFSNHKAGNKDDGGDGTISDVGSANKADNRYVEYIGNENSEGKGLYGRVGFVISDASVQPSTATIMIRETQGDNKWYASFKSYNGTTVPLGEVWNVSDYYYIDYAPNNVVAEITAE